MKRATLVLIAITGVIAVAGVAATTLLQRETIPGRPISQEVLAEIAASNPGHERYWGDELPESILEWSSRPHEHEARHSAAGHSRHDARPQFDILAISGGGANGAFTAGLLQGWTESGKRFEFDIVTGVSAGALVAPFAFLGPDYDQVTVDFFSRTTQESVFRFDLLSAMVDGWSLADSSPLRAQIDRYVTQDMIDDLAREHDRGRSLLVKTINLDLMRPVVWNLTAIAADHDDAAEEIRRVLLASATLPILFPPVAIPWETNDRFHTELHADGSLSEAVFAYPHDIEWDRIDGKLGTNYERRLFVIWNGSRFEMTTPLEAGVHNVAGRATAAMIVNKTLADIERLYYAAVSDEIAFRLVDIPKGVDASRPIEFDPDNIAELIKAGREIGRMGDFWRNSPHRDRGH